MSTISISRIDISTDNAGRQVVTLTRVLHLEGNGTKPVSEKFLKILDYHEQELGDGVVNYASIDEYEVAGVVISELLEAIDLSAEWKEDKDIDVEEQTYEVIIL